jgi:hypothetical protein
MKRVIAVVLAASMALQASGCTTTYSAPPTAIVSKDATTVRAGTVVVTDPNPAHAVATPASIRPPDVPTSEFLGSPAAGILAGVALIGVIGLVILAKGGGSSSDRGSSTGGGVPSLPD